MKLLCLITIFLGFFSLSAQNNQFKSYYYEGGDEDVKIQLRMDVYEPNKDLKFKLRHEDKEYSSINGISNLVERTSIKGINEAVFNEKPMIGNGTVYYISGTKNGVIGISNNFTWVKINLYKWDDFYDKYQLVKSYNLYEPNYGLKLLMGLLKD